MALKSTMPTAETPLLPLPPDWRRLPVWRVPQSLQSSPKEHIEYSDPGPPSSQSPSLAIEHVSEHAVEPDGEDPPEPVPRLSCETICRANDLTPASCPRMEPLRSITRTRLTCVPQLGAAGGAGGAGGGGNGAGGGGGDGSGDAGGGDNGIGEAIGGAGASRSHTRENRCEMSKTSVPR